MINWNEPGLEASEGRSSSSLSDKAYDLSFPDSCSRQADSCRRWLVHVSHPVHSSYFGPGSHLIHHTVGNLS
jgi:hypothetical protein